MKGSLTIVIILGFIILLVLFALVLLTTKGYVNVGDMIDTGAEITNNTYQLLRNLTIG